MNLIPNPAPEGRYVQAGSNSYYLIEMGAGDPVFLLHGGGPGCTSWSDFGLVAPMFAENRRCLMPDLLQYGKSDKSRIEGPMWDHHARSMAELMDALEIERADFVCNSWGGTIALCFVATYPQRARSLTVTGSMPVFYGPLAPLPEGGRRGRNARDLYYGGQGPSKEKMRALIARLEWYNPDLLPDETVAMRYLQSLDAEEMRLAASSDSPRGDWQDLTEELGKVQCPTLFCWGLQDDFLTPDYPLMLTRMVQRGQLHVLDASSHHLQEERPEHYFHIVRSFLDQPEPEDIIHESI
ncbi:MAG: alpha/beta hydrolase [Porticoccaceae bacterium]|jgi:pimeloyl-ACP methyl ester carboxylesterase|nr:alpha/beta hydrolase [Porticoccaceae bacterium]MBT4211936.1 alpha/beta hydrolase [Porticoccaceae bacterium]MBT4592520.1 alpha/beta hydrolase [Porticoccaceae bacterium]MBT5104045.1 alpha/beta hydrolase [Porticoccaceae bacterium]MBT6423497.1 alpha/beta hydrolase [Porticoccaceae bacterium]